MENIIRYNIMRHITASQAQLETVSRSLADSYSNILIDAKKKENIPHPDMPFWRESK